jgi:hypothetical protein
MIPLEASDVEGLELTAPQTVTEGTAIDGTVLTAIHDNITLGQARIMTGDVGTESWGKTAGRKVEIAHNRFGGDVQIMTGSITGESAARFTDIFWGSG